MVTKDGVIARLLLTVCLFYLSGSQILTGWTATMSGVMGTIFLATALLRYSPIYDLYNTMKKSESEKAIITINTNPDIAPTINNKNKRPA